MSCYGYARQTTPFIDSVAQEGLLFENAYAPSSWTVPSTATILTGLQPQEHGLVQGILQPDNQVLRQHQLHPDSTTLAEKLRTSGYETFGYSANSHITRAMGFGQGFNTFREINFMNAEFLEALIMQDLPSIRGSDHSAKPYFLFMHFVDPHWPYMHRPNSIRRLGIDDSSQSMQEVRVLEGDPMLHFSPGYFREHESYLRALTDLYDGEIAAVDEVIGRILAELPRSEQAMIAILSDHGEAFSEHDTMLHGYDLYEETVRVPLILRLPKKGGQFPPHKRISERAMLIDIMPTLLKAAGVDKGILPGVDLTAEIPPSRETPLHLSRGPIRWHGAIVDHRKGIVHEHAGRKMLFDIQSDPGETKDLYPQEGLSDDMNAAVERAVVINPKIVPHMITNAKIGDINKLKSLGYLSGGVGAIETPWIVSMGICPRIFDIDRQCGKEPEYLKGDCVGEKIDALKKEICPGIKSFNLRKKCEQLRLNVAKRLCGNGS